MAEVRAASRYAKSLLELADEKGVLEEVHNDMLSFTKVCKASRELVVMLKNPVIKHDQKRIILEKIFKGKVHNLTLGMFDIITRKNREPILPVIATEFHKQYNFKKDIAEAKVTTAVPLDDDLRKQMIEMVKKISSKSAAELIEVVDKELIGGYILRVGDRQIDESIKSKLKALELKFSQNPYIKEF